MGMGLWAQQYGNETRGTTVWEQDWDTCSIGIKLATMYMLKILNKPTPKRLNINSRQDDQHPHPAVRENTRDTISILHTTSLDTVAKTNWLQMYVIEGGFEVVAAMLDKPYTLALAS